MGLPNPQISLSNTSEKQVKEEKEMREGTSHNKRNAFLYYYFCCLIYFLVGTK
jgi:hypothetical protein